MVYNKEHVFVLKVFNNIKNSSKEHIEGVLRQLHPEASSKIADMLTSYYNKLAG